VTPQSVRPAAVTLGGAARTSFSDDRCGPFLAWGRWRGAILVVLRRDGRADTLGQKARDDEHALAPRRHRANRVTDAQQMGRLDPCAIDTHMSSAAGICGDGSSGVDAHGPHPRVDAYAGLR